MNDILNKINKLFDYKLLINNNDEYNLLKKFHNIIFLINTIIHVVLEDTPWAKKRDDWYKNCVDIVKKKNYNELDKIIKSGNEIYEKIYEKIYEIINEINCGDLKNKLLSISKLLEKIPTFLKLDEKLDYLVNIGCYTINNNINNYIIKFYTSNNFLLNSVVCYQNLNVEDFKKLYELYIKEFDILFELIEEDQKI